MNPNNCYLAYVLTEDCRQELLSFYPPRGGKKAVCHHVTISYNLNPERLDYYQQLIASDPVLEVHTIICTDIIDFFRVKINGKHYKTDQSMTHLTHSKLESAKNRDSNRVILGEYLGNVYRYSAGGILSGEFKLLPK
jgi:hypothetical protein